MTALVRESELQEVIAVSDEEADAIRAGDIGRYLAILSADAVFLPPNLRPKTGEDLRDWLRDFVQRVSVEWTRFTHEETVVVEDLAYHTYSYRWKVTPRMGGEPVTGQGKGIQIYWRIPGAGWKLSRSIWNADPAE
jgi:ketosteroid isomerase-like protein